MLAVDGISDFNALHFGKRNDEVQPCAFDILAGGGSQQKAQRPQSVVADFCNKIGQ